MNLSFQTRREIPGTASTALLACCSHLILYMRNYQSQPLREVAHTGSRARRAFGQELGQELSPRGAK